MEEDFSFVCDGVNVAPLTVIDTIDVLETEFVLADVFDTELVEVTETLPEGVFVLVVVDVAVIVMIVVPVPRD